jgi:hypothetical protein
MLNIMTWRKRRSGRTNTITVERSRPLGLGHRRRQLRHLP